jgi:hypothetical protein
MDEVQKVIQRRNETLIAQQMVMTGRVSPEHSELIKGVAAAEGEVRTWNGVKYVKQGKTWVEQSGAKKGSQRKPAPQKAQKKQEEQAIPSQKKSSATPISSAEKGQLVRVKQAIASKDIATAAKIANSLSDDAKNIIPSNIWSQLHSHNDTEQAKAEKAQKKESEKGEVQPKKETGKTPAKDKGTESKSTKGDDKESGTPSEQRSKSIAEHASDSFKNFVSKNKKLFDTQEHAHPERSAAAKFLRGKVKGIVKGLKHEVEHIKEAGSAIKKVATGKFKDINDHEKKALKKIGISLGITVGSMLVTGGLHAFSHGAVSAFQHIGHHFVEHTLLEVGGLAAIFAKANDDDFNKDDDAVLDEGLDKITNAFIEYIENGDWSQIAKDGDEE